VRGRAGLGSAWRGRVRQGKARWGEVSSRYGRIRVRIRGMTPLLMNRPNPERLMRRARARVREFSPEKDAAESAYVDVIDGRRQLYIPAEAVYGCILAAAQLYKAGGQPLSTLLRGTIRIEPEKIPLGTDRYEIDVRPVIVRGARVMRARAKVPDWSAQFYIVYDRELLAPVIGDLRRVLEDAGRRVGILDFRPQKGGWFGTFTVEEFEVEE
jgi:hypothetical protein